MNNVIPGERLALCIKISQKKWIEKLKKGSAWFGAINNYIVKAETSDNNEQGDKYEGVFAHIKKNNPIINEYQCRLGNDLEIIEDGDYCFLRRNSSRRVCAFCMYGVKNSDLETFGDVVEVDGELIGNYRYYIEPKMYSGFLQDGSSPSEVAGYYCSSGHLINAIESSLNGEGYCWRRNMIEYDIDITQEFFIEPEDNYPELFHKRKELKYQHEMRMIIINIPSEIKGINVPFEPISEDSGNWAMGELYIQGTAIFKKIEN